MIGIIWWFDYFLILLELSVKKSERCNPFMICPNAQLREREGGRVKAFIQLGPPILWLHPEESPKLQGTSFSPTPLMAEFLVTLL